MHGAKIRVSGVGMAGSLPRYNFVIRKMESDKPYIITVVGPESSGKTTVARQLADMFGCPWVPEYARTYLPALDRPYNMRDLEVIAARQLEMIEQARNMIGGTEIEEQREAKTGERSKEWVEDVLGRLHSGLWIGWEVDWRQHQSLMVVDGGMLTLRMWARLKYGTTIPLVEEALADDITDHYLLCRPVLPWEPDPLREASSLLDRVWIYNQYLQELTLSGKKFHILG